MTDDFWRDRFHHCALAAGFIAAAEGRLGDSRYVRDLAYRMYEDGAFASQAARSCEQAKPAYRLAIARGSVDGTCRHTQPWRQEPTPGCNDRLHDAGSCAMRGDSQFLMFT
jgi:hypothetical protein